MNYPGRLCRCQPLSAQVAAECYTAKQEANLARARKLLEQEIARNPAREENKAGLAQMLVLRADGEINKSRRG
jgi:hypothetical protein